MKITHVETVVSRGDFATSRAWQYIRDNLHESIKRVDWPHGSGTFSIYPEKGKKKGMGNGVPLIKVALIKELLENEWVAEDKFKEMAAKLNAYLAGEPMPPKVKKKQMKKKKGDVQVEVVEEEEKGPGGLDATLYTEHGPVVMEWETGNVSSSHRAMNKMALGLMRGQIATATLVVPNKKFAYFLTDRVGNWEEIRPYLDIWRLLPISTGVLEVVVIEHDAEDWNVQRIPKGTDGWAKI